MSRTALIVIDMINAYDFPDAEKLIPSAERAVPVIRELIEARRHVRQEAERGPAAQVTPHAAADQRP